MTPAQRRAIYLRDRSVLTPAQRRRLKDRAERYCEDWARRLRAGDSAEAVLADVNAFVAATW